MLKCPGCGFANPPGRERCLKCNALLESRALPNVKESAFREASGSSPLIAWRRAMYFLGRILATELPRGVPYRWVWSATFLSWVPGGGALYNHQPVKAAIIAAVQLVIAFFFALTFFQPINDLFALLLVISIFLAMADGFHTAARLNGTPWRAKHFWALFFAMMFFVGATVFLVNYFGHGLFYTTNIRTDAQSPSFNRGDRIFVLTPILAGTPRAGQVVYYDPGRYAMKTANPVMGTDDTIVVNEKSAFGVVTAMAGERLSMGRDGVIRVNEQPVGPDRLPPNPNGAAAIDATVPPDSFGILLTHGALEGGAFELAASLKGHGGVYGVQYPTPRDAARMGYRLEGYESAVMIPKSGLFGVAIFRYYPPERRTWWGWRNSLWRSAPPDYPKAD
jgi:hypothetical protein